MALEVKPLLDHTLRGVDKEIPFLLELTRAKDTWARDLDWRHPPGEIQIIAPVESNLLLMMYKPDWSKIRRSSFTILARSNRSGEKSSFSWSITDPLDMEIQELSLSSEEIARFQLSVRSEKPEELSVSVSEGQIKTELPGSWSLTIPRGKVSRMVYLRIERFQADKRILRGLHSIPLGVIRNISGKVKGDGQIFVKQGSSLEGPIRKNADGSFQHSLVLSPQTEKVEVGVQRAGAFIPLESLKNPIQKTPFYRLIQLRTDSKIGEKTFLKLINDGDTDESDLLNLLSWKWPLGDRPKALNIKTPIFFRAELGHQAGRFDVNLLADTRGGGNFSLPIQVNPGPPKSIIVDSANEENGEIELILRAFDSHQNETTMTPGMFLIEGGAISSAETLAGGRQLLNLSYRGDLRLMPTLSYREGIKRLPVSYSTSLKRHSRTDDGETEADENPDESDPPDVEESEPDTSEEPDPITPPPPLLEDEEETVDPTLEPSPEAEPKESSEEEQAEENPESEDTEEEEQSEDVEDEEEEIPVSEEAFVEDRSGGQGQEVEARSLNLGETLRLYAVGRTREGDFVENLRGSWSFEPHPGGVTVRQGGKEVEILPEQSGEFYVQFRHTSLPPKRIGPFTVPEDQTPSLSMEAGNDGSASPITSVSLESGSTLTLYPVLRNDAGGYEELSSLTSASSSNPQSLSVQLSNDGDSVLLSAILEGEGVLSFDHGVAESQTLAFTVVPGDIIDLELDLEFERSDKSRAKGSSLLVSAGEELPLKIIGKDAQGNPTPWQGKIKWTLDSSLGELSQKSSHWVFKGRLRGEGTLTGQSEGFPKITLPIQVQAGSPTQLKLGGGPNSGDLPLGVQIMTAGQELQIEPILMDAYDNFSEIPPALSWKLTKKIATLKPTQKGVMLQTRTSGKSSLICNVGELTAELPLQVLPGPITSLHVSEEGSDTSGDGLKMILDQQVTLKAFHLDAFGNRAGEAEGVQWKVSDEKVAILNRRRGQRVYLSSLNLGKTTLTAEDPLHDLESQIDIMVASPQPDVETLIEEPLPSRLELEVLGQSQEEASSEDRMSRTIGSPSLLASESPERVNQVFGSFGPKEGSTTDQRRPTIFIEHRGMKRGERPILLLNGQDQGHQVKVKSHVMYFRPSQELPQGQYRVEIRARNLLAEWIRKKWSFTIGNDSADLETESPGSLVLLSDFPKHSHAYSSLPSPPILTKVEGGEEGVWTAQFINVSGEKTVLKSTKNEKGVISWAIPNLKDGSYRYGFEHEATSGTRRSLKGSFSLDRSPPRLGAWSATHTDAGVEVKISAQDHPHNSLHEVHAQIRSAEGLLGSKVLREVETNTSFFIKLNDENKTPPLWVDLLVSDRAGNRTSSSQGIDRKNSDAAPFKVVYFDNDQPLILRKDKTSFSGWSTAKAELTFRDKKGGIIGKVDCDEDGQFNITDLPLEYGENPFSVTFEHEGRKKTEEAPLRILDTQGPVFYDLNAGKGDRFSKSLPNIRLRVHDDWSPISYGKVQAWINDQRAKVSLKDFGVIEVKPLSPLPWGRHQLRISGVDQLGNSSPDTTGNFALWRIGGKPASLQFVSSPKVIPSMPAILQRFDVRVFDSAGDPASVGRIGLWTDRGKVPSSVQVHNGVASFDYEPSSRPGEVNVLAYLGAFPSHAYSKKLPAEFLPKSSGPLESVSARLSFRLEPPFGNQPAMLSVEGFPEEIQLNQRVSFKVRALGPEGRIINGAPINVSADFGSLEAEDVSKIGGSGEFLYIPPTQALTDRLHISCGNLRLEKRISCVFPPNPIPKEIFMRPLREELPLWTGASTTILFQIRDNWGRALSPEENLTWTSTSGSIVEVEPLGEYGRVVFYPEEQTGPIRISASYADVKADTIIKVTPPKRNNVVDSLSLHLDASQRRGDDLKLHLKAQLKGDGPFDGTPVLFFSPKGRLSQITLASGHQASTTLENITEQDFPITLICESGTLKAQLTIESSMVKDSLLEPRRLSLVPPAKLIRDPNVTIPLNLWAFDQLGHPVSDGVGVTIVAQNGHGSTKGTFTKGSLKFNYRLPEDDKVLTETFKVTSGTWTGEVLLLLPPPLQERVNKIQWKLLRRPNRLAPSYEFEIALVNEKGTPYLGSSEVKLLVDHGHLPSQLMPSRGSVRFTYYPQSDWRGRVALQAECDGKKQSYLLKINEDVFPDRRGKLSLQPRVREVTSKYRQGLWFLQLDFFFTGSETQPKRGDLDQLLSSQGRIAKWDWVSSKQLRIDMVLPPKAKSSLLRFQGNGDFLPYRLNLATFRPVLPGFPGPRGHLPNFPSTP